MSQNNNNLKHYLPLFGIVTNYANPHVENAMLFVADKGIIFVEHAIGTGVVIQMSVDLWYGHWWTTAYTDLETIYSKMKKIKAELQILPQPIAEELVEHICMIEEIISAITG